MQKAVVLHSGGLDSTALLYHMRGRGYEVLPLSILYGQKHSIELKAAALVCRAGNFWNRFLDLRSLNGVMRGSSQTDREVQIPEGHYSEDNMAITVVPNRNMVLLSAAVAYAISEKAVVVAYAAHKGDHAQYPDCRVEFIEAMMYSIALCDNHPPVLMAPYAGLTKADIVLDAINHGAPLELTWSCYKGQDLHCGRCGTCVERAEAFYLAGVEDPTQYVDKDYWRTVTTETKKG